MVCNKLIYYLDEIIKFLSECYYERTPRSLACVTLIDIVLENESSETASLNH